jgi:poly(3-hydroxybutyrate) depolymerase
MSTSNMVSTPPAIAVSAAPEMTICIAFEAAQPPLDPMRLHGMIHTMRRCHGGQAHCVIGDGNVQRNTGSQHHSLARNVACAGTLAAQCPIAMHVTLSRVDNKVHTNRLSIMQSLTDDLSTPCA